MLLMITDNIMGIYRSLEWTCAEYTSHWCDGGLAIPFNFQMTIYLLLCQISIERHNSITQQAIWCACATHFVVIFNVSPNWKSCVKKIQCFFFVINDLLTLSKQIVEFELID